MSWLLPQLWIGSDRFPFTAGEVPSRQSLQLWEGVHAAEFQIAGYLCHHQTFFGLVFRLPDDDPLAKLGDSYAESCIPGVGNPDAAPQLDAVLQLRERLRELGLNVDPARYFAFAEAYLPLDPELAWHYAVGHQLKLIVHQEHSETEFWHPSELGLREWSEVSEYLGAAWQAACSRVGSAASPPSAWNAVAVLRNSD